MRLLAGAELRGVAYCWEDGDLLWVVVVLVEKEED